MTGLMMRTTMKKLLLSTGLALSVTLAVPAMAQVAPATAPVAGAAAPIDPARRAAAEAVVNKVFPAGTYRRMMEGTMTKMMSSMTDQMLDIPMADLARIGGISEAKLRSLKPATTRQVMKIIDPAFDQRMHATMDAMMPAMVGLMETMEPDIRAGVMDAYANHFTTAQLIELDRFFSTPTGSSYAGQSMLIMTDPAVIDRMGQMMPKMMAAMPEFMKKVKAATASIPPAPKADSLTAKQKADLAALLGPDAADDEKK
jgi:hypothetical protein